MGRVLYHHLNIEKVAHCSIFKKLKFVIQWEAAHDGLSCNQFAAWKIDNDAELQAQGLAAYLNEEDIGKRLMKYL